MPTLFLQCVCQHFGTSTVSPFDNESFDRESYTDADSLVGTFSSQINKTKLLGVERQ